jgi:hypothetical protein
MPAVDPVTTAVRPLRSIIMMDVLASPSKLGDAK